MKVVVTEQAWSDMLAIGRTIANDNPTRADSFLNELYERCLKLGAMPKAYPLIPNREEESIRRRPYGNYLIFYRISIDNVEILHVLHGARDYEKILFPGD